MLKHYKQLLLAPIMALFLLTLALPTLPALADDPPIFILKWGSYGSGDGQFRFVCGVAVDSTGNVYTQDNDNYRIQKFTNNGTFLTKWDSFTYCNIAVDSTGNVYAGTYVGQNRIQKFTSSGTFLTEWGSTGSENGQFLSITGIAIDSADNVYVVSGTPDSQNRIQKFTSSGTFLTKWGSYGSGDGQFWEPYGVATDSSGNVYVADTNNHRIQKFTGNGAFLAKWGSSQGSGDGQFNYPWDVAVDGVGNVYVADYGNDRIQKFDSNGNFLTKWGSFHGPTGVAVDSLANIYVSDSNHYSIQKFGQPMLNLTKAVDTAEPALGQQINYIIAINNSGLITATQALISDTLPESLTFAGPVKLDPPQSAAIPATTALSMPIVASNVTIAPQTSITLTLPVTVNVSITDTTIINTAVVTCAEADTMVTGQVKIGSMEYYLPIIFKNH